MKKVIVLGLIAGYFSAFAQSGEVTNAILAYKEGSLNDAKTSIDKATEHEKTKNEPKTWFHRGKIYESIAADPTLGKQYPEAAKTAIDAYKKARQLDETAPKPNKFKKDLDEAFASPSLGMVIQNGGVDAYQKKDFPRAYEYFTLLQEVKPQDTIGYIYAAQMALANNDYKNAKDSYWRAKEKTGYVSPDMLNNLLYIYKNVETEKDLNKALEVAQLGKTKYPQNSNFAVQEIDLLAKLNKLPEAIKSLEGKIQGGEGSADNYVLLGSLFEKSGQVDKAKEAYMKSLSLNPNSYEANYNLGAIIYNPAVEVIKQVRNMNVAEYNKKGKTMEAQAKDILKQSLPYFEKAYQIKQEDEVVKQTLKDIYLNLGQKEKANALK